MNRRLLQFLKAENISQSQFADTIGVARASVSHILAGRNKPGFDFLLGMSRHYPALNLEWLITGKGRMYAKSADNLFDDAEFRSPAEPDMTDTSGQEPKKEAAVPAYNDIRQPAKAELPAAAASGNGRNISKIIVFYDDNSYQELV